MAANTYSEPNMPAAALNPMIESPHASLAMHANVSSTGYAFTKHRLHGVDVDGKPHLVDVYDDLQTARQHTMTRGHLGLASNVADGHGEEYAGIPNKPVKQHNATCTCIWNLFLFIVVVGAFSFSVYNFDKIVSVVPGPLFVIGFMILRMILLNVAAHKKYIRIYGTWISLLAILSMSHSQIIRNKPSEDEVHCHGQVLLFMCETRGSLIITWRSIDYIGPNRLQFSDGSTVGDKESASGAIATLTRNVNENGERVLESQLRITVNASISSTSIVCARDNGSADSFILRVLLASNDDFPIISDQRENSVGGCEVHFSWAPPSDLAISGISHYNIAINGTPIDDERNVSGVAMRVLSLCTCGTHNISIATVNRCGALGKNVTRIVSFLEPNNVTVCDETSKNRNNPPSFMCNENETPTGVIIAILLLISSLVTTLILAIVLILVCFGLITPLCSTEGE